MFHQFLNGISHQNLKLDLFLHFQNYVSVDDKREHRSFMKYETVTLYKLFKYRISLFKNSERHMKHSQTFKKTLRWALISFHC